MADNFTSQRMLNLFGSEATRSSVIAAEKAGAIPSPERSQTGSIARRVWPTALLPQVGERYGFMKRPQRSQCIAIYSAKGGVFKTTLALNLGRMAALHNIRTCIVGLDFQCDLTRLLGENPDDGVEDIETAIKRIESSMGLLDIFTGEPISAARQPTDIPTLDFIPETAGLISLERTIGAQDRREYKLRDVVIDPMRDEYDLVIVDCPPSWSHLITNAIVACDVLLSPVECKISQFNSLSVFRSHIAGFQETMGLQYQHIYVPTRFTPSRRLSSDIRSWYMDNLEKVSMGVIRESAIGEEATAAKVSLPEHAPTSPYADEMRELLRQLWGATEDTGSVATIKAAS